MNVCFFAGNMSNGGGTERMTQLLANEISADNNYKVFVLSKSLRDNKTFFGLFEKVNLSVLDKDRYNGVMSLIKDIFLLRKFVIKNKIDVLINVDVSLGIFSLPLKILCPGLKQIFWEHFSFHYDIGSKKTQCLRKFALKYANAYVTLTPQDTDLFKCLIKKCCLVTDIPNICVLEKSEKEYNIDSKKIISIGNLLYVKGFDYAIAVAKQVFERHPDWSWELYGDGTENNKLHELVCVHNIKDKFIFKGRTDDIESVYQDAAIFVMTSRTEGFGLVTIEAQSFNLPAVAFDVPYGPRNIIKNNENGFLIEPFDIEDMADKICVLIEKNELRRKFSEKAANELLKYSAKEVAFQWKKLLGGI